MNILRIQTTSIPKCGWSSVEPGISGGSIPQHAMSNPWRSGSRESSIRDASKRFENKGFEKFHGDVMVFEKVH